MPPWTSLESSSARRLAAHVALAALALQSAGLCAYAWRRGGPINTTVFLTLDAPERWAIHVDHFGGALLAMAAIALLKWRKEWLALFAAAWTTLWMVCAWIQNASYFEGLTPFAWAIRVATPIAVWGWLATGRVLVTRVSDRAIAWFMRVACATTFATHGVEALRHHPRFIDLILGSDRRFLGGVFDQSQAETMLDVIGAVDLAAAALVLLRPRSIPVVAWMVLWGTITAASRMTCWGWTGFDLAMMRTAHGALPLALLFLIIALKRSGEAKPRPELLAAHGEQE